MVLGVHACRNGIAYPMQIFKKAVIFKGDDNVDQLRKIAEILGTSDIEKYIQKYKFRPDAKVR